MPKESSLWDFLRVRLPRNGKYDRIESETSPGFPDVVYTIESVTGFLELKSSKGGPIPFNERTGLRDSQKIWISDAIQSGATVWIVAQVENAVHFIHGSYWRRFNTASYEELHRLSSYTIFKFVSRDGIQSEIRALLVKKLQRST